MPSTLIPVFTALANCVSLSLVACACLPNSSSFLTPSCMPAANSAKSATNLTRMSPMTAMSASPPRQHLTVDLAQPVVGRRRHALADHEEVGGPRRLGVGRAHDVDDQRAELAGVDVEQLVGQRLSEPVEAIP